jgi:hypothetical protein
MVHTNPEFENFEFDSRLKFHQHLVSLKHVINIIMGFGDMGCYTLACYRGACKTCGHAATVRFNSATSAQLTTPVHDYSGDITRQDSTTVLAMFSTTE